MKISNVSMYFKPSIKTTLKTNFKSILSRRTKLIFQVCLRLDFLLYLEARQWAMYIPYYDTQNTPSVDQN